MGLSNLHRALLIAPLILLATACSENETTVAEPEIPELPTYDAQTFYNSVRVFPAQEFAWSVDNQSLLVSSNRSGIYNVYEIDVESGEGTALTDSDDDAYFLAAGFPADDRLIFSADNGGNELSHVYVRETDGNVVDLTPGEGHRASFAGWQDDGKHFYIVSNERDNQAFDLYRVAADGYERTMIFENTGGWMIAGGTSDASHIVLQKNNSSADNDLYLLSLADENAAPQLLTENDVDVSHAVFGFTPDNTQLVYGTDEHSEFRQAWTYDVASGEKAPMIEADWDVVYVTYSDSGRYRVHGINADARTVVTIHDQENGTNLELPALDGSPQAIRFSRDESRLSLMLTTDTSPSDLYVIDLAGGEPKRLTSNLNAEIDESVLVNSEVIRYPSFDGLEIPSILYRPQQASADAPVPALVWVHGGPGGQSRTGYSAMIQHLVNHGYAVLAANNRGSSGYGKTFFHLDDKRHGEVDLDDIVYGKKYLQSLDWVDTDHIGIIGGSYGGYMVGAALAFRPEEFNVGVNIFGVMNWVRTLESIPPWWDANRKALYDELGDPATDMERLRRISPLFHAGNIQVPMLVVQGANDPRVLKIESDEIVEAVRKNGVTVDYLIFEDEGHGFSKRENEIAASESIVTFLNRELKPDPAEES